MFKNHFRSTGFLLSIILTTLIAISFTLSVVAQAPERDSGATPDIMTIVEEEELTQVETPQVFEERDSKPAPDKVTIVREEEAFSIKSGLQASEWYHFISANTFVPNNANMDYAYHDAGCMYRKGGGTWTEHTVQLPQGAEIDYLRVYFYDNDPVNNAMAYLAAYSGTGTTTFIATASSSDTPGQSSAGSGFFSHIVDNGAEAISVSLSYGNGTTNALRICGIRIHYYYSPYRANLPIIQK